MGQASDGRYGEGSSGERNKDGAVGAWSGGRVGNGVMIGNEGELWQCYGVCVRGGGGGAGCRVG